MHILIIPSWYPNMPGDISGSFFREQALALQKRGCKVGVIYPQLRSLRSWRTIAGGPHGEVREIDCGMPVFRSHGMNWFPMTRKCASKLWIAHGLALYRAYKIQYGEPDIIHAHSIFYAGELAKKIKRRDSIPFVLTEHSSLFLKGSVGKERIKIAAGVFSSAEKVFAVSQGFAERLSSQFSETLIEWGVMPNIVSDIFGKAVVTRDRAASPFTFVSLSALIENKGISQLLTAFARAFVNNTDVILKICGEGPEHSRLEKLVHVLGIDRHVHFTGALTREQVVKELASSDALVHPSQYETFGVVLIEALALGKPVVATKCGGPNSIVEAKDGILVAVNDVAGLASAMKLLRKRINDFDPDEIRRSCLARFGEDAVVRRLMAEYSDVLSRCSST